MNENKNDIYTHIIWLLNMVPKFIYVYMSMSVLSKIKFLEFLQAFWFGAHCSPSRHSARHTNPPTSNLCIYLKKQRRKNLRIFSYFRSGICVMISEQTLKALCRLCFLDIVRDLFACHIYMCYSCAIWMWYILCTTPNYPVCIYNT